MKCPSCGSTKQIVCLDAPIGGVYVDPISGIETPRLRCAECGRSLIMKDLQPSRPPKGRRRATLSPYDRTQHQNDRG